MICENVVAQAKFGTFKMWKNYKNTFVSISFVVTVIGFVGNSPCFCSLCQAVYCRLFCHKRFTKKKKQENLNI